MTLDSQTRGVVNAYVQGVVSNGNPREQAFIRRWWQEAHGARGRIVWEYYLAGQFTDAVWFCDVPGFDLEESGLEAPKRFPLRGNRIVLCEAKSALSHQLIGQAVVYRVLARRGAQKSRRPSSSLSERRPR